VSGGRKNTGLDAIEWAEKIFEMGAGEILLTSMDGDGTQNGYDIELTRCISEKVSIPVIASGGAGSLSHIKEAFTLGKSSAALLASLLHDGQLTIREIKEYLIKENLPIRPIE
jgi:cyclase